MTVSHKVASDPAVWCEYADAAGMAQGGRLRASPPSSSRAPGRSRRCIRARWRWPAAFAYERADYAAAALHWRQLLATLPANEISHRELLAAIARAEKLAGRQPGRALLSSR